MLQYEVVVQHALLVGPPVKCHRAEQVLCHPGPGRPSGGDRAVTQPWRHRHLVLGTRGCGDSVAPRTTMAGNPGGSTGVTFAWPEPATSPLCHLGLCLLRQHRLLMPRTGAFYARSGVTVSEVISSRGKISSRLTRAAPLGDAVSCTTFCSRWQCAAPEPGGDAWGEAAAAAG